MVLLIDAYNLLKQLFGPIVSEKQRSEYIQKLATYAMIKRHRIILMFDGGFFEYPTREKQGNVESINVGKKRTADQAIMEYIDQHTTKDTLLISSDRALIDYASNHDVVALDSVIFSEYIKRALEKPKTKPTTKGVYKLHPESGSQEIDALMLQASEHMEQKPEDQIMSEHRLSNKGARLSKRERRIMTIVKKL